MNELLRMIALPLVSLVRKREESRHFSDIIKGPKVYLNGKPYIKVKLRLVDTLDFKTGNYIDQLEGKVESGSSEIESLKNANEALQQKIIDLQNLNVNLMRELRTKLNESDVTIRNLTDNLKNKEALINELKMTIRDSNPLIDFMKEQIAEYESKLKSKDNRVRSLEAELQHIKSTKKYKATITREEIEKYKRGPVKNLKHLFTLKEIEEKDIIIKILKDREKDHQRKIDNLLKQIEELKKELT